MPVFTRTLVCLLLLSLPTGAVVSAERLVVEDAWVPEAPPVARVLTAYMRLVNNGKEDIVIEKIESPDFEAVEIHRMENIDNISRMIQMKTLTIPAGKSVSLKSGGIHLMLMKPKHVLKDGGVVSLEIYPQGNHMVYVKATVRKSPDSDTHTHHHH